MKNTHYRLILIAGAMVASMTCGLESVAEVVRDSAQIWFHQSKWDLDENYRDNGADLNRMIERLRKNESSDSALKISAVRVIGAASPEGNVAINAALSRHRADRIFDYVSSHSDIGDFTTDFEFVGRDWAGLKRLVEADDAVPMRQEVIGLIDEIQKDIAAQGADSEANLLRLKCLGGGVPYRYMYARMFPQLRYSSMFVEYTYRYPARLMLNSLPPAMIDITAHPPMDVTLMIPDSFIAGESLCHPFYMGIKTNMLYDALALPSIGVEFYLGKEWSIAGNWTYGWWDKNSAHRYWRAYGGDIAVRRWFGKAAKEKPLTGHHLGIYAGVVTYDFEFGGKGYLGGLPGKTLWDRCNYMAGVEYGYSLPIARRLNIDFTLGIGYLWGKMIEYKPYGNEYVWQNTKRVNRIGPTKAEVSLVWLIGCDNYNRRKGGMR